MDDVKSISCGDNYTLILKNNGMLYSCGNNEAGQLGLGNKIRVARLFTKVDTGGNNVKSIQCGVVHSFILKDESSGVVSVYSCGFNESGQLGLGDIKNRKVFTKVDIDNVKSISCGSYHTFITKNDTGGRVSVYACGNNGDGQLGLGNIKEQLVFTKVNINI